MTENKRFEVMTNNFEISIKDRAVRDYPFSIQCENIDEFEPLLQEVMNVNARLNKTWEQTQRFEKYSQEYLQRANQLEEENEQLKQFISKIDFAIIRKYDNSIENLLDEVYDGEYENWIKKQVLRAKKLDGDVE